MLTVIAFRFTPTETLTICLLGSGELEFEEFCNLAAQFLIEEDAEQMQKELKEAFRLYDKEGNV
jgi:Ca2+-binding EF-hand superfamily protein